MKQIFVHTLKYWPLYSLLSAVVVFYVSFMVFRAEAVANIEDTENLKLEVKELSLHQATVVADVVNIKNDISDIKRGVNQLTDYLLKKK